MRSLSSVLPARLLTRFAIAAPTEVSLAPSTVPPSSTFLNVPFSVRPLPSAFLGTELISSTSPGMHSIKDRAVVVDGKIVIRPIMVVALTCVLSLRNARKLAEVAHKNADTTTDCSTEGRRSPSL